MKIDKSKLFKMAHQVQRENSSMSWKECFAEAKRRLGYPEKPTPKKREPKPKKELEQPEQTKLFGCKKLSGSFDYSKIGKAKRLKDKTRVYLDWVKVFIYIGADDLVRKTDIQGRYLDFADGEIYSPQEVKKVLIEMNKGKK